MLRERGRHRYATVLGVDATSDQSGVWTSMVHALEAFARAEAITHINAIASYAPWSRALERSGFGRLKEMPVWLLDTAGAVSADREWHFTAMKGDLGYLMP